MSNFFCVQYISISEQMLSKQNNLMVKTLYFLIFIYDYKGILHFHYNSKKDEFSENFTL